MVVHLTAAAHHVADIFKLPAVARAAGGGAFFQNVDVVALHLTVAHQIAGRRQGRKAAAHDIGGLLIHALGLAGTGKGFVIAAGIIHAEILLILTGLVQEIFIFRREGAFVAPLPLR